MRSTRFFAGAALLALTIILAACGQAVAVPASPTPSATTAPSASDAPSVEPSPTDAPIPTEEPTPTPGPIEVIVHELPMIGRPTTDGVDVRTLPSLDAPLITGEIFGDGGQVQQVPELRLTTDMLVVATLGPLFADGESWYEVSAADGGDVYFSGGWVAGRYLSREGDLPEGQPIIVDINGVGSGTAASQEVPFHGTPTTVRFAATPMPDRDACEIEVTLIRTDGAAVNVATESSLTEPMVAQLSANELSSLFQEEAGRVTLQVRTDCSYAATLTLPPV